MTDVSWLRELREVEERFWKSVDRRGDDKCWPWTGSTAGKGYGVFSVRGKQFRANRFTWELHNGQPFPDGMFACHHCDNPGCANPRHIFPGTNRDNLQDAARKGRCRGQNVQTCPKGHPYEGDNLGKTRGPAGRVCRECDREYKRNFRLTEKYRQWRASEEVRERRRISRDNDEYRARHTAYRKEWARKRSLAALKPKEDG